MAMMPMMQNTQDGRDLNRTTIPSCYEFIDLAASIPSVPVRPT